MSPHRFASVLALSILGLVGVGCAADEAELDEMEEGSASNDLRTEEQRRWAREVRAAVSSYTQCKAEQRRSGSTGTVVMADGGAVANVPLSLGACEAKVAPLLQPITDACIASFSPASPFAKGHPFDKLIPAAVTVFGRGVAVSDTKASAQPELVIIASGTNVLGDVTYQMTNPNAWYCMISTTNVLGNLKIQISDKSHVAMVSNSGAGLVTTSVMGNVSVEEVRN